MIDFIIYIFVRELKLKFHGGFPTHLRHTVYIYSHGV